MLVLLLEFWTLLLLVQFYILFLWYKYTKDIPGDYPLIDSISTLFPVSVVICSKNGQENLRDLLPILGQQNHGNWELIIIDDNSNPPLELIFPASIQGTIIRLTDIPEGWHSKKWALHQAFKAAKHSFILCTDDDCNPDTINWISSFAENLQKYEVVLGISPYEQKAGLLNTFIRFETWLTAIQYTTATLRNKPYMSVGRNVAYRKEVLMNLNWDKIKGLLGGDDDIILQQLAHNNSSMGINTNPISFTTSKAHTTWKGWFLQKARHYGVASIYTSKSKWSTTLLSISFIGIPILGVTLWLITGLSIFLIGNGFYYLLQFLIMAQFLKSVKGNFSKKEIILGILIYPFIHLLQGLFAWWPFRTKSW